MTPDQLFTINQLFAIIGSTVGSVVVVGISLAILILRNTSRLDTDRRAFQAAADTDRRAFQAAADADRRAFQAAMDAFRAEMQRLAERQSHVEGRVAERGAAAD